MTAKAIILVLWALFLVSPTAEAEKPSIYRTMVTIQVLCSGGGPELLMKELLDNYNEKPIHAMDLSSQSGSDMQMYITENRNNPSSTLLLHNRKGDKTCIFWSAEDYLRTIETESLPAKKPEGMKLES